MVILAALVLILCACSNSPPNPRVRTVTKVPGSADSALPEQITFAIDSGADEIIVSAAESFCHRLNSLSSGAFILNLSKSGTPIADLRAGNAGFILLDGNKAPLLHPYFAIANERFRYSGYENFSMACNSAQVLSKLSGVSKTKVYAAYYTGSNVLGGSAPLDEMLAVDRRAEPDAPPREVELFTIPDSDTDAVFKPPIVTSVKAESFSERIKLLYSGGKIIELSFSELQPSQIAAASSSADDTLDESESIAITRTFHSITPTWLILSPSFYETLTPFDRAAIDEAATFVPDSVDRAYLELEQERLDALEEAAVLISNDFLSTRMKILRLIDESPKDSDEKYFRELLGRI